MALLFGAVTILKLTWRHTLEYTRFEKARIIGARALQLSMGAPTTLGPTKRPKDVIDPVDIAMIEFKAEAIPITVKGAKE